MKTDVAALDWLFRFDLRFHFCEQFLAFGSKAQAESATANKRVDIGVARAVGPAVPVNPLVEEQVSLLPKKL